MSTSQNHQTISGCPARIHSRWSSASVAVWAAIMVAVAFAPLSSASAQDGRLGLGLIIGDPTGLTGKHHFSGRPAFIDWAVGFPLIDGEGVYAHADFLWQPNLSTFDRATMDLYFGVGPKLAHFRGGDRDGPDGDDDSLWLGARAPLGLSFNFNRVPIEVFVELAAGLWVIRVTDFDLDAAAGFRWWF